VVLMPAGLRHALMATAPSGPSFAARRRRRIARRPRLLGTSVTNALSLGLTRLDHREMRTSASTGPVCARDQRGERCRRFRSG
jgi:hypothetical protein